ncbi:MAG: hypothetical protein BWY84_01235 [Candidatus Aerophobetes bacterium ADurb.Bin490]|nr:MAG: hypothetical protein BWY84_01235 [Candidatus Aerophobetes bacterium ADurb.Bin490]
METFTPIRWRFSAISRPIKPPPTIAACFTFSLFIKPIISSVSFIDQMVFMQGELMPGILGFIGVDPVAITSLS